MCCVATLNKTAIFIARYLRPWRGNKYFLEVFGFMAFLTLQLCDLCWCYFSQEQLNNFWPKKKFSTKIFSLHEMFLAEFVWCLLFILNLVHKRTSAKIAPQGQNGEREKLTRNQSVQRLSVKRPRVGKSRPPIRTEVRNTTHQWNLKINKCEVLRWFLSIAHPVPRIKIP